MTSKLFSPIEVGPITLQHRVVLAPLTRFRATRESNLPLPIAREYYEQRSRTAGTLLISEGVIVAPKALCYDSTPGIWNEEQILAWAQIVDAVHNNGSFIFLQLWAGGRSAIPDVLSSHPTGPHDLVGPSPIPDSRPTAIPRELTLDEITEYVELFATAAKNAVRGAGFDGVEVHVANGYLLDQFLQDTSNQRTDIFGGSIENRSRFPLEVVRAVANAAGENRTGVRISPWSPFGEMKMANPIPQFTHFVSSLKDAHPTLAYLHAIEPRIGGAFTVPEAERGDAIVESNDFIRDIWSPKVLISAGNFTRESALERTANTEDLIAFGRRFISNPDLPVRLQKNIPLANYDRSLFYTSPPGKGPEFGYIDYPFAQK
ncbi:unnamed protein product [Cyclocybe aegerita]|uniref:NADH:flavin oxidoreductase/NADH oxidase N-terminal domain-containing protein n=1 Tax=Cyclocybe aegerita TaxID=1973307 RepID=A0A8S0VRL8_CYCAE|nr:unnamed protein product [Cyclocybe aegerita]